MRPGTSKLGGFAAIGGESVVADALEARGQHMQQEATQELLSVQAQDLSRVAAARGAIAQADVCHIDERSLLRDPMGVAG